MERKRTLKDVHQSEDEEESTNKRLSLRERKRSKSIADGIATGENKEQKSDEEEKVKSSYMISGVPVVCGAKLGLLDVKKLEGGEPCIMCEGKLLTPPAFECLAGKRTTKKWKASIFLNKKPLKFWFEQGYLSTKGFNWGNRALKRRLILQLSSEPKELSNGESDMDSSGDSDEDDIDGDDWPLSNEEQALEAEEKDEERAEEGKEEAGVYKKHDAHKSEDDNLQILDTDDDDATDISDYPESESVIKEDLRPITSTPEKLGLQKEVKIVIERLPVTGSDWQSNNMKLRLEESSNKSLGEDDHNVEMTDDSSVSLDDLFFTSVMKKQLPQILGEAETGGGEEELKKSLERQNEPSGIKTESLSYEEEEAGELNEIRKKEHLDMSISRYNSQLPAAEVGDPTSRSGPEQLLVTEEIFQPSLRSVSKRLSLLVHQNNTLVEQLQGMTPNTCAPQTSQAPDVAEAPSASSSGSDEEARELNQLKREKLKLQIRVLKLEEEYFTFKLNALKKMKN